MKKAVIQTGGKQYLVQEGETLQVELLEGTNNKIDFEPLLLIEDGQVKIGTSVLTKIKVTADVIEADTQTDKVTSIRYKAKKRVHKIRGHRQRKTTLKINKIVV